MSRKGNCWDNAVAESFFATLKSEEASRPYLTRDDARAGIARYIHGFYNSERLHSSLGYKSPNEFAKQLKPAAQTRFMASVLWGQVQMQPCRHHACHRVSATTINGWPHTREATPRL